MSRKMIVSAAVNVSVGKVRQNNEDNIFLDGASLNRQNRDHPFDDSFIQRKSDFFAFAVCDGMGGQDAGEEASLIGVRRFNAWCRRYCETGVNDWQSDIGRYFEDANASIYRASRARGYDSGSTSAVLVLNNGFGYFANVGDSRIYLLRSGALFQISVDHTLDTILQRNGETAGRRRSNMLTRYLGGVPEDLTFQPTVGEPVRLMDGDTFLMCSDGLTDMVTDEAISEILLSHAAGSCADAARMLVDAALENGGKDNCSVLIVSVESVLQAPDMPQRIPILSSGISSKLYILIAVCLVLVLLIIADIIWYFHLLS